MPRKNPPPPPRPRTGPPTRTQTQSALQRVRKLKGRYEAVERPFEPERAPSWRGSSRDLVVNRRHRKNAHQTGFGFGEALEIQIPTFGWRQIGGDMNPGSYGGIIARADGNQIELVNIQPVREYVGDKEAAEVGFPFWTQEATYDLSDLSLDKKEVLSALQSVGIGPDGITDQGDAVLLDASPEQRALIIAEALMGYGYGKDEAGGGWAADLLNFPIEWWGGTIATFPEYCGDEDDEFRRDVLEEEWHFVYGAGLKGYLFNYGPYAAETEQEAIDALVDLVTGTDPEISEDEEKRMRAALAKDGYYEFDDPKVAGNEYAEITLEDGPMPEEDE
jgi:hypothetical protein